MIFVSSNLHLSMDNILSHNDYVVLVSKLTVVKKTSNYVIGTSNLELLIKQLGMNKH